MVGGGIKSYFHNFGHLSDVTTLLRCSGLTGSAWANDISTRNY